MNSFPQQQSCHMTCSRLAFSTLRGSVGSRFRAQRLADQQRRAPDHRRLSPAAVLCSRQYKQLSVARSHLGHTNKPSHLRRALLGGILLSVGAMPFSSTRAAAAELTADKVLEEPNWPASLPFRDEDFQRYDPSSDEIFYDQPRFVTHIDDGAIAALTKFYERSFPPSGSDDVAVLDLCSSWISHYPKDYKAGRIAGLGMNEDELKRNVALTEWAVKDLNEDPMLPYEDNSFDVVTNAVSVDYLTRPLEMFREMHRVLKPGGQAIISFSNRCFPTKAIAIWTATGDLDHIWIVGAYYHYSVPGGWTPPKAEDITQKPPLGGYFGKGDPMYVVHARKTEPKDM